MTTEDTCHRKASHRWMWLGAALLMSAELALFVSMTGRHYAGLYPRWNDQIQYLTEAYLGYDQARAHGLWSGLAYTLTNPVAQGAVHDFFALLVFAVTGGPSRGGALALNMLVFIAWQAVLLFTMVRVTQRPALGWLLFALVLSMSGPWADSPGSAIDFRLDHAAMCLLGITAATALLTDGFRKLGWSVVFGAATACTLVERFLAAAYLVPIYLILIVWLLSARDRRKHAWKLLLAGLIAAVLAGPFFWSNREHIYEYYIVGHLTGSDSATRAPHLDWWHSLSFVVNGFGRTHLGFLFLLIASVLVALPFLLESYWEEAGRKKTEANLDWLVIALAFLAVPLLVLCVHPQKSEVVLGALAPGLVLLLAWTWHRYLFRLPAAAGMGIPGFAALAAVILSFARFSAGQVAQPHSAEFIAGAKRVDALAEHCYAVSRATGFTPMYIGIDQVTDSIDAKIFRVMIYERYQVWLPLEMPLPATILAEDETAIWERLRRCDFFLLTQSTWGSGSWPYDRQMDQLRPQIRKWCEGNLRAMETFPLFGYEMTLYQRRSLP